MFWICILLVSGLNPLQHKLYLQCEHTFTFTVQFLLHIKHCLRYKCQTVNTV